MLPFIAFKSNFELWPNMNGSKCVLWERSLIRLVCGCKNTSFKNFER